MTLATDKKPIVKLPEKSKEQLDAEKLEVDKNFLRMQIKATEFQIAGETKKLEEYKSLKVSAADTPSLGQGQEIFASFDSFSNNPALNAKTKKALLAKLANEHKNYPKPDSFDSKGNLIKGTLTPPDASLSAAATAAAEKILATRTKTCEDSVAQSKARLGRLQNQLEKLENPQKGVK